MADFNCCYHFVSPGIHGFFPFRETFRNHWLCIEFLHNRDKQHIRKKNNTISKIQGMPTTERLYGDCVKKSALLAFLSYTPGFKKNRKTWNRVFDGRGPILQKYRHLRSGPTGVCGWCSLGIALSFSCISSSTKLLGTSTLSGVTPTCK